MCLEKTICDKSKYDAKKSPAEYIKEKSGEGAIKWIPIGVRKPKPLKTVLITVVYRNRNKGVSKGFMNEGRWFDVSTGLLREKVTAWMDLPEPY